MSESEPTYFKKVPANSKEYREVRRSKAEVAYDLSQILRRLNIQTPNDPKQPDFTLILDKPTRDLRIILPALIEELPEQYWWWHEDFKGKNRVNIHF